MAVKMIYEYTCDDCGAVQVREALSRPAGWNTVTIHVSDLHNPDLLQGGTFDDQITICGNCGTKLADLLLSYGSQENNQNGLV